MLLLTIDAATRRARHAAPVLQAALPAGCAAQRVGVAAFAGAAVAALAAHLAHPVGLQGIAVRTTDAVPLSVGLVADEAIVLAPALSIEGAG